MIIRFTVIGREGLEINRVWEVTCDVDTRMNLFNRHDVIEAIKRACNRWAKTNDGITAYEYAGGYFNFGDLYSCLGTSSLEYELAKEGINELKVEDNVDLTNYFDFDTILMTEEPTEE